MGNQNDADAISPYSQFPNPKGAIYQQIVERGFSRLPAIPELIKKKNVQGVMQMLQSDGIKRGISYMSKPEGSPAWQTQKEILTTMSDVGAYNNQRKWGAAQQSYDELMGLIGKWKQQVNF